MDYYYSADSHHDQSQYPPQPPQQEPYDPAQASLYDPSSSYSAAYHHYYNPADSSALYHPPDAYAHLPPADGGPQQQSHGAYNLNPAAAAVSALSQLSQFAGTMDVAERAMAGMHGGPPAADVPMRQHHYQHPHPYSHRPVQHGSHHPIGGGPPYSGGDRWGGGTFRGRNRGNFGNHSSRPDGGSPPFRGRGRGRGRGRTVRGGGRQSHQSPAPLPQAAYPAPESTVELLSASAPAVETSSLVAPVIALSQAQAPATMIAAALPKLPLLPVAWCDICRVDCNSLEILEQHKNGKRHKRTVQRIQEIQAQQKLMDELQAKVTGKAGMVIHSVEDTITASVGEASKALAKHQSSIAVGKSQPANLESSVTVPSMGATPSEAPPTEAPPSEDPLIEPPLRRQRMDGYDRYDQRNGPKRNLMRLGRGGKRMRYSESQVGSRPRDRPREQPRVCTLCNCMCDTLLTFEAHLTGKKHISRIKRFQGHGMVYGPVSVYIPPNQPTGNTSQGLEPLFFGLTTPEMIQQGAHVYTNMATESFGHQQGGQPALTNQSEDGIQEVQAEHELKKQEAVVEIPDPGSNAVVNSESRGLGPSSDAAVVEAEKALAAPESGAFPAENVASNIVKLEYPIGTLPVQESGGAQHNSLCGPDGTVGQTNVPNLPQGYGAFPAESVPFSAIDVEVEEPSVDDDSLANGG